MVAFTSGDEVIEGLLVEIDGEVIAQFGSNTENPEDSGLTRMGIGMKIALIVEALGGRVEASRIFDEDLWYEQLDW